MYLSWWSTASWERLGLAWSGGEPQPEMVPAGFPLCVNLKKGALTKVTDALQALEQPEPEKGPAHCVKLEFGFAS